MNRVTRLGLLTLLWMVLACFGLGCGDDDEEQDPNAAVIAEAQALTGPIQQAIENPTGIVDETTARAVLEALAADSAAAAAMSYVPGAAVPGAQPQSGDYESCVDAQGTAVTVDLSCASGGEVTGTVVAQGAQDGSTVYAVYTYQNVCAGDVCINGTGAMSMAGTAASQTIIMAGEFDVLDGGESYHLTYGYRMTLSGSQMTLEYVVFVDGESYVLSATLSGESGSITITGDNGSFTCTYTASGASGHCSGQDGSFSW